MTRSMKIFIAGATGVLGGGWSLFSSPRGMG